MQAQNLFSQVGEFLPAKKPAAHFCGAKSIFEFRREQFALLKGEALPIGAEQSGKIAVSDFEQAARGFRQFGRA